MSDEEQFHIRRRRRGVVGPPRDAAPVGGPRTVGSRTPEEGQFWSLLVVHHNWVERSPLGMVVAEGDLGEEECDMVAFARCTWRLQRDQGSSITISTYDIALSRAILK